MSGRSARALRRAGILGFALLLAPATASSTAAAAHTSIASASTAPYDAVPAQATAETSRAEPQASAVTIPDYAGYVTDAAGVMDEAARAKLESFLDQVQKRTGVQFAVLAVKTTAPLTPSEYKVQVFQRWKIGERGKDNGLLMLVALDEHQVRFETGYGLEGTLPDGLQSRIFRREMAPRFRTGDYAGGITQGVLACAARIAAEQGVKLEWDGSELRYEESPEPSQGGPSPLLIALIAFIVLALVMSRAASNTRGPRGRSGWDGGWGGFGGGWGGGGFGGGGGGGGGGFGGFGGGSSGGGGGGGSW